MKCTKKELVEQIKKQESTNQLLQQHIGLLEAENKRLSDEVSALPENRFNLETIVPEEWRKPVLQIVRALRARSKANKDLLEAIKGCVEEQ
jgi:hypothetical protein